MYGIQTNNFLKIKQVNQPYRIHYPFKLHENDNAVDCVTSDWDTSSKLTIEDAYSWN